MSSIKTIFGPPGTGKTTRLAGMIAAAVERFGSDRVVVASLTRTAAAEILGRGINVDPEHVGTLHAVCYRALGRPPVVDKTVSDFNKQHNRTLTPSEADMDDMAADRNEGQTGHDRIRSEMDLLRVRMIPRALWPAHVVQFAREWDDWKAYTGTVDFPDMIEKALQQFDRAPGNPAAVYYDEAQDGSALELALIRQWAAHTDHTRIAGDDDQALFSWRGASVESFLAFSDGSDKEVLGQSYRLPRAVQRYAQRWAEQINVRHPKAYEPRAIEGEIATRELALNYPEDVLAEVEEHVAEGRSVMLLATCGYMLHPLVACMRSRAIPFHNPYRTKRGDWNPLRIGGGMNATDRVLAFAQASGGVESRPWTWRELHAWVDVVRAEVLPRGAKARCTEHAGEHDLVSYGVAKDLLGPEAWGAATAADVEWLRQNMLDSKKKAHEMALDVAQRRGLSTLRRHGAEVQGKPGKGVMVGTVHSVKGGEADVVYLWPDLSQAGMIEYHDPAKRNNVLRTLYVGMTRAAQSCYLCASRKNASIEWLPVEGS